MPAVGKFHHVGTGVQQQLHHPNMPLFGSRHEGCEVHGRVQLHGIVQSEAAAKDSLPE